MEAVTALHVNVLLLIRLPFFSDSSSHSLEVEEQKNEEKGRVDDLP